MTVNVVFLFTEKTFQEINLRKGGEIITSSIKQITSSQKLNSIETTIMPLFLMISKLGSINSLARQVKIELLGASQPSLSLIIQFH